MHAKLKSNPMYKHARELLRRTGKVAVRMDDGCIKELSAGECGYSFCTLREVFINENVVMVREDYEHLKKALEDSAYVAALVESCGPQDPPSNVPEYVED